MDRPLPGVRRDLSPVRYETWDDLALYYRDDPALRWTDDRSDLLRAIHPN